VAKFYPALFCPLFGKFLTRPPPSPTKAKGPDKGFVFTPIDWKAFRAPNSRDLAVIKSQLVGFSRPFSVRELQVVLAGLCEAGDGPGVQAVLRYATVKRVEMLLNVSFVPQSATVAVLKYLTKTDPQRAREIAREYFHGRHPPELGIAAIDADSAGYLSFLANSDKCHKRDLRLFAKAIGCISFDRRALQQTVVTLLQRPCSSRKLPYLMLVVVNCLSIGKTITPPFLTRVLALFAAHKEDGLVPLVARALFLTSLGLEAGPHVPQITALLATVAPQSPEGILLYLAVSRTTARDLFDAVLARHLRELCTKRLPSLFAAGLRLLQRALQPDIPEAPMRAMLKHTLPKLIECFPRFYALPSVAESAVTVWLTVLTVPSLKSFQAQTVAAFEALMPLPSNAAFTALSPCLPHFLSHAPVDLQRQITATLPALIVAPVSLFLLKAYLKTASKSDLSLPDGYQFSEAITEILNTLSGNGGLEAIIPFLKNQLLCDGIRFFPVFVAILRLRKTLNDTQAPRLASELAQIGAGLACRAHGSALAMLGDRGRTSVALGLSQFDGDCEETALLLRHGEVPDDQEGEEQFEPISGDPAALFESISGGEWDWAEAITPLPPSVLSPPDDDFAAGLGHSGPKAVVSVGLGDFEPLLTDHFFPSGEIFEPITPHGHSLMDAIEEFEPVGGDDDDFEAIPEGELSFGDSGAR
jgi:hypothetical protein